ncbi:MAG: hypothetical protein ACYTE6_15925, partial [Planctomycetota bacterium]
MCQLNRTPLVGVCCVVAAAAALLALPGEAQARNNIREAFFDTYPGAVGTPIETVASFPNHCGNCHYAFGGGGPRNPYGQDLETALADFPNNPNGRRQAVVSIENLDCDTDGYNTLVEVTDTVTFGNTPTFAGLTPANIGQVSGVDVTEIQLYLVPSTGQDLTPPEVTVTSPNGGELLTGNNSAMATWTATDASGIAAIDLYLSLDNGATFKPVAIGLSNTG